MKIIFGLLLLVSCGGQVRGEGFKFIDLQHPQVITGVFTDMKGNSDGGVALAIVTYSNWCPVAIGGSMGRSLGGPSIAIGTSMNLLPSMQVIARTLLDVLYPDPVKFQNLKSIVTPPIPGKPDVSMSFGPHWSYVLNHGTKGKGMVTWFYGASWAF